MFTGPKTMTVVGGGVMLNLGDGGSPTTHSNDVVARYMSAARRS